MTYRAPGSGGPPAWLVILVAGLLVFGGFFVYNGVQNYLDSNFQGFQLAQATAVAEETAALTTAIPAMTQVNFTAVPTRTPIPACQEFVVTVPEAIIRECPDTACAIQDVRREGAIVCVLEPAYENDEWYIVDLAESEFLTELAYMHESLLRAINPTPTPSITPTPMPTLTPEPSNTPLPTPLPSLTPEEALSPTPSPTFTPSATPPLVNM